MDVLLLVQYPQVFRHWYVNLANFQSISLLLAGARTKCSRIKMEREEFRAVIKHFYLKSGQLRKSKPSWMKFTGTMHRRWRPFTFRSKRANTVSWAGKVMATVFWDAQGIFLIDYLQKCYTITREYYAKLLSRSHEKMWVELPKLVHKKKTLFHQDNVPAHSSAVSMAKVHELGFKLLPHSPYSLDLAPSDFFLFPSLKFWQGFETSNFPLFRGDNKNWKNVGKIV